MNAYANLTRVMLFAYARLRRCDVLKQLESDEYQPSWKLCLRTSLRNLTPRSPPAPSPRNQASRGISCRASGRERAARAHRVKRKHGLERDGRALHTHLSIGFDLPVSGFHLTKKFKILRANEKAACMFIMRDRACRAPAPRVCTQSPKPRRISSAS